MGATTSVFTHDLRTPTRSLHSRLELPSKSSPSSTFTFSQEMKKGVGEEQTLITRVVYSGRLQEQSQDVVDHKGRTVKGNPLYLLHPERVHFEVEWGSEWYQAKKGRLVREDLLKADARTALQGKKKCTPIVTSTVPPPHPHLNANTETTAPPSPSTSSPQRVPSPASAFSVPASNVFSSIPSLPPPADIIPRGFSHTAPLSPAPLTLLERQRSHADAELGLGERPIQSVTALDKPKASSSTAQPSTTSSLASASPSFPIASLDSPVPALTRLPSFHHPSAPRSITVTFNGSSHSRLQQASSLEEMTDLLQQDSADWVGTFSPSALVLRVEVLSEEVRVEYFKPKFEYLWAQVMDDCPIIMALSNVFHDSTLNEMYLPRNKS